METETIEQNGNAVLTPEKEINTQLQQKNLADEAIAELKSKYGSLKLEDINDKVTLSRIHDARMEVRDARIGIEKFCKQAREKATAYSRAVIGEEKRLVNLIEPLEEYLMEEENKPAQEKLRLELEEQARIASQLKTRIVSLVGAGMNYNGSRYFLNERYITEAEIKTVTDEEFEDFLSEVKAEQQKVIAEKERVAAEALKTAQEQARIQKEQDAKQAELDRIESEQRLAQNAIDAENKRLAQLKWEARANLLKSLGMQEGTGMFAYGSIRFFNVSLSSFTDEEFNKEVEILKGRIGAMKIQEKKAEEDRIESARQAAIIAEQERLQKLSDEKQRKLQLAPDKEKLQALHTQITSIPFPEFTSAEALVIVSEVGRRLMEINFYLQTEIKKLS